MGKTIDELLSACEEGVREAIELVADTAGTYDADWSVLAAAGEIISDLDMTSRGTLVHLYPSGKGAVVLHEHSPEPLIKLNGEKRFRPATEHESRELRCATLVQKMLTEIGPKQTALVEALVSSHQEDLLEGFGSDYISNLTPDPSEWSRPSLVAWICDNIDPSIATESATDDELRSIIRDQSEPEQIASWRWVSVDLAGDLIDAGEVVLVNDFGQWWGRGDTEPITEMDHRLNRVARHVLNRKASQ